MDNKYYLAGPMSGLPQHNFPAFEEAAEMLRSRGYQIVSPVEFDDSDPDFRKTVMADETGKLTNISAGQTVCGHTRGDLLGRDVKLILDECQGIIALPGWDKSRGARLEVCAALSYGHRMYRFEKRTEAAGIGFYLQPVTPFAAFSTMMKRIKRRD